MAVRMKWPRRCCNKMESRKRVPKSLNHSIQCCISAVTRRKPPNAIDTELIKMGNGTLHNFVALRNNPSFRKHFIALKIISTLFNFEIFFRLTCHKHLLPLFRFIKGADITCRAFLCSRAKKKNKWFFSLALAQLIQSAYFVSLYPLFLSFSICTLFHHQRSFGETN